MGDFAHGRVFPVPLFLTPAPVEYRTSVDGLFALRYHADVLGYPSMRLVEIEVR